jgi:hypothetical protein
MDVETCHVCNQPLDDVYSVTCTVCHRRVHFQSAEDAAQACSRLHIQLLVCGLAFICEPCFQGASSPREADSR